MNGILPAAFFGALFGTFNGFVCRLLLKKNIDKSDRFFFGVFIGGILYRLLFLVSSVLYLKDKKDIILITYAVSLIFFQFIFELKPVKKG